MEYMLWGFVFVLLMITIVLLIATTVFLVRIMKDITKDMPSNSPVKAYKERKAQKEDKKTSEYIETILANISSYDGTSNNQRDVPRG